MYSGSEIQDLNPNKWNEYGWKNANRTHEEGERFYQVTLEK